MKFILKNKLNNLFLAGLLMACQPAITYLPKAPIPNLTPQEKLVVELIKSVKESEYRTDSLWQIANDNNWLPFTFEDSVYFFYKGEADSVAWYGDFNAWGGDSDYQNEGQLLGNSLWLLKTSLPTDARVDYKVVVNNEWMADPYNDNVQFSGVDGVTPNSELRMPGFQPDTLDYAESGMAGSLISNNLIKSKALGYITSYQVFLPPAYDSVSDYPLLILTDGQEFLDERLGRILPIINILSERDSIKAPILVLLDPRNPENTSQNRRMDELANNPKYARFIAKELLPLLKTRFNISKDRTDLALGGVSLGALNAAYTAHEYPDSFGKLVLMSPAFWYKPEIYSFWANGPSNYKIYISTGTINDTKDGADKFVHLLENANVEFQYDTIPQGHSWGNWRYLTDDMLIYLFGK